jgi:riboflavin synthase
MFTGLVETTGTILSLQPTGGAVRLTVAAPQLAGRWRTGDSIAVNGVCLTAIPLAADGTPQPDRFAADLAAETVQRTTLSRLEPGATVNLELPTPAGAPLGGHVVQGHVDGTATLVSAVPLTPDLATTDWRLTFDLPAALAAFVIPQGSITVDGISLTVARLHSPDAHGNTRLEIAIIPHTWRSTHLHTLQPGALVNIEADVLAKYAGQHASPSQAAPQHEWLTGEFLMANGY